MKAMAMAWMMTGPYQRGGSIKICYEVLAITYGGVDGEGTCPSVLNEV